MDDNKYAKKFRQGPAPNSAHDALKKNISPRPAGTKKNVIGEDTPVADNSQFYPGGHA